MEWRELGLVNQGININFIALHLASPPNCEVRYSNSDAHND